PARAVLGPRQLHDGVLALRSGAEERGRRGDRRGGQGQGGRQRLRRISQPHVMYKGPFGAPCLSRPDPGRARVRRSPSRRPAPPRARARPAPPQPYRTQTPGGHHLPARGTADTPSPRARPPPPPNAPAPPAGTAPHAGG